jgi:tripartite-type tricarboxylate transporter receptor subunit TctC
MVTHPSSPYKTVQDVLNAAKAKPGVLNFASAGIGSGTHLNLEKLKLMSKVDMNHVPYKGSAEAMGDVVGGRVDFYFAPVSTMQGQLQAGKIRAIAVSTIKRSSVLPSVPTIAESGVPGFDFSLWFGIWPATTRLSKPGWRVWGMSRWRWILRSSPNSCAPKSKSVRPC